MSRKDRGSDQFLMEHVLSRRNALKVGLGMVTTGAVIGTGLAGCESLESPSSPGEPRVPTGADKDQLALPGGKFADNDRVCIEVGRSSLTQMGLHPKAGLTQSFDPSRIALIVLNDAIDVRYEILAGTERVSVMPHREGTDTVIYAVAPGCEQNCDLGLPSRLFRFEHDNGTYPRYWFQTEGASKANGPFDTAFVYWAPNYTWTHRDEAGLLTTLYNLPDGVRVFKAVRDATQDKVTEILPGSSINQIVLARTGGYQQNNGGDPWPP